MASLRQLTIKITGESSGFERAIAQAQRSAQGLAEKLTSVGSVLAQSVTLPIGGLALAALKAASDMQSLTRGLQAVTKEAGPLTAQLDRLKRVAELPGLGFKEAVQGSINLQAAGFSARTAERALSAFGNALATVGKGRADLNGVVLALTQIQAKGKVSAEEINQLAERLPQIRAAMTEAFGTADPEKLQKLGISSEAFVSGIIGALEKLKPVTGGLGNSFENLKDQAQQSLAQIGQALIPFATKAIETLTPIVDLTGKLGQAFKDLPGPVQTGTVALIGIVAAVGPISFVIGKVKELQTVVLAIAGNKTVQSVVGAIAGAVGNLAKAFGAIVTGGQAVALTLGGIVTAAVGAGLAVAYFLNILSDPKAGVAKREQDLAKLRDRLADLKNPFAQAGNGFQQLSKIADSAFGNLAKKIETVSTKDLSTAFSGLGIKSTAELQKALKDAQDFAQQIKAGVEAGTASQLDYARALEVVRARQAELSGAVESTNKFFKAIPFNEKTKEGDLFNLKMGALIGNLSKLRSEIQELAKLPSPDIAWANQASPDVQRLNIGLLQTQEAIQKINNASIENFIDQVKRGSQETRNLVNSANPLFNFELRGGDFPDPRKEIAKELGVAPRVDLSELDRELRSLRDGAIRDLSGGFVDAITKAKSFGEAMRDVAASVSRNILQFAIERGIKLLIGELGNLLSSLGSVGSAFGKIFGNAGSLASSVGGAASSAGGSVGSVAGGIAGGSIGGIVTAVSGVVTAVSSVIGLFQTARIEKDVGRIEVTTRGILNESLNLRAAAQLQYDGTFQRLGDIWNTLKEIRDTRGNAGFGSGGGGQTVIQQMNVYAGATNNPRQLAQATIREMKLMGART